MNTVLDLFPLGYCDACSCAIREGQTVCDVRTPDGSVRVHLTCMESCDTLPPEPRPVSA